MRKFKGLFVLILLFVSVFFINSSKSLAADVQYTGNVIPTMTSNTSPSGIASASSIYSSGFQAFYAFDHNTTIPNVWASIEGIPNGWLAYEFKDAKSITKYTITSRKLANSIAELPKDWTFEAWDDNISNWVILDTKVNFTDWSISVKKEFTFENSNSYNKYRLNISANGNSSISVVIGELEMMETIPSQTTLTASVENTNINLSWSPVTNVHYYNIKRSTTAGGPYTIIARSSAITFNDSSVTPGTTYYYAVSAVISNTESSNSNEVFATPTEETTAPGHEGIYSTLILTMTNGGLKSYELSINDLDNFLTWYDNRSNGIGKAYYVFNKTTSNAPYVSVKEYISFDKISSFEVKEFN